MLRAAPHRSSLRAAIRMTVALGGRRTYTLACARAGSEGGVAFSTAFQRDFEFLISFND